MTTYSTYAKDILITCKDIGLLSSTEEIILQDDAIILCTKTHQRRYLFKNTRKRFVQCYRCKKTFERTHSTGEQKYCSNKCRDAAKGERVRRQPVEKVCEVCGQAFLTSRRYQRKCKDCIEKKPERKVVEVNPEQSHSLKEMRKWVQSMGESV